MKRNLIALLVATSSAAMAQENRMEHVIVSVPIHKKTAETNLPVTVLTGEELRRAATTSPRGRARAQRGRGRAAGCTSGARSDDSRRTGAF